MAQVFAGISAVQEGGLENGVFGEGLFYAWGVDAAAGLILEVVVAADVIGVGVGVVDGFELPVVGVQKLSDLSAGVFVVSAVN